MKSENIIEIVDSDDEGLEIKYENLADTQNGEAMTVSSDHDVIDLCGQINGESSSVDHNTMQIKLNCDSNQGNDVLNGSYSDTDSSDDLNHSEIQGNLVQDSNETTNENADKDTSMITLDSNPGIQPLSKNGSSKPLSSPSTSFNGDSRSKHGKRFKCKYCPLEFQLEGFLKNHLPVHANGKLIGVKADSNGLYRCTLCIRRFIDMGHLSTHMNEAHKNGQYLYHCTRCMRQFVQKEDKDRHESRCKRRYFECHLCKVFVSHFKQKLKRHMRTHAGSNPFLCMVCNKPFKVKYSLKRHLNTIHNRINS